MASEISITPKTPNAIDQTANLAKGLGLNEKAAETVKNVVSLLGGRNVSVDANARVDPTEAGKPTGATGIPALDDPADVKQLEQNLEKLLSYLQMDNEERQAAMAKDRIEVQKDTLEAERNNRSEKIEKSLKDMDKAAESRKASRIFGWLMTALAVVAAVVACVATGGVAVGPVIGAGIAIACQVLSETGAMDKIAEKLAEGLEKLGMGKNAAKILSQVILTVAIIAASLGSGFIGGGGSALANTVKGVATSIEKVRAAVAIATSLVGVGATVAGGVSTYDSFKSGMTEADVKELEKVIAALKQRLDESEEELQQIIQQLQAGVARVAEMLASATDTSGMIASRIGEFA